MRRSPTLRTAWTKPSRKVAELVAWAALAAALAVGGGLFLFVRWAWRDYHGEQTPAEEMRDEMDQLRAEHHALRVERDVLAARLNAILVLQQSPRENQPINDGV